VAQKILADLKRRMEGAVDTFRKELGGLRTGRASASLLDPIVVEVYGANMPLAQVATISVPEARMLTVQVWDRSAVSSVDKAIRKSGLGVNPVTEGQTIRIPIPELTEERRRELTKVAAKYAEQARVAARNVRRDGIDALKKLERDGEIGQDDQRARAQDVQKMTDDTIARIDELLAQKDKEIMQV